MIDQLAARNVISGNHENIVSLQAIAKLSWTTPTIIQEKAIPLFLEGKDVLLRARTGSGKTAAFAIPVIQKVLNSKVSAVKQQTSALILAPSKELCRQVKNLSLVCTFN